MYAYFGNGLEGESDNLPVSDLANAPASAVVTRLATERDRALWDEFVGPQCRGILMQSWGWGELRRRYGWSVLRLIAQVPESGAWAGAIQILHRPVGPFGIGWAYAPRGPALSSLGEVGAAAALLARAARDLRRRRVFTLRVDPEWPAGDAAADHLRRELHLHPADFDIQHRNSWEVDLDADPLRVSAGLPSSTRRNIRIAERQGVSVERQHTAAAAVEFYQLHLETVERQNFRTRPLEYYQLARQNLRAEVFIARQEGVALAAAMVVAFGPRLIYLYGGTSANRPEARASYALHWAAIEWGIGEGCQVYDMWGVPRDFDPQDPSHGYATFKTRWGGRLVSNSGLLLAPMIPLADALAHRVERRLLRRRPLLT